MTSSPFCASAPTEFREIVEIVPPDTLIWLPLPVATSAVLETPLAPPSIWTDVLMKAIVPPLSAVAPVRLLAVVVPFGGPSVIDEPVALIVLPVPVAHKPVCVADVAVVAAVVRSVLPLKKIVLPDCANPPVVVAARRFSVMPLPVICPPMPEALSPKPPTVLTLIIVPGETRAGCAVHNRWTWTILRRDMRRWPAHGMKNSQSRSDQ